MAGPLSEALRGRGEGVPASQGCHTQMSRCVLHEDNEKSVFHSCHLIEVFHICILYLYFVNFVDSQMGVGVFAFENFQANASKIPGCTQASTLRQCSRVPKSSADRTTVRQTSGEGQVRWLSDLVHLETSTRTRAWTSGGLVYWRTPCPRLPVEKVSKQMNK